MISQTELKTLVPSLVMSGVLLYEAITGNAVSEHMQGELVNGILIGAGYMVTLWGIWKNHQKNKPPEVKTPSSKEVDIKQPDVYTPSINPKQDGQIPMQTIITSTTTPISTQADYNQQISK
jgi:hypothetical protein